METGPFPATPQMPLARAEAEFFLSKLWKVLLSGLCPPIIFDAFDSPRFPYLAGTEGLGARKPRESLFSKHRARNNTA